MELNVNNSILKNLSYNLVLQVVLMILPLVTIPYVSRVLGADGIGVYSFTLSLTQYFIILGTLGLSIYGNRQIAYTRDNKEEMSKAFWSIFILRFFTTATALVAYYLIFWSSTDFRYIRMIQSFHIVSAIFDVTWLYIGLEDFKRIVTRNLLVKLVGVGLIFALIKTHEDVTLYTLINLGMSLGSSLIMWLYVPKMIVRVKVGLKDVMKHLKPALKLFIPQIASQVYVLLDKTMIGTLSSIDQVGFYTQAERLVKSIVELVTALGVVMLPRMSNIFAKGQMDQMNAYLNRSLIAVSFVSIPMVFGIIGVAPTFIPLFLGEGFEPVVLIIMSLSPILIFISLSSVLGVQYLLPANRVREFTISIVAAAVINIILNIILIPRYQALGAVVGTVSAELTVLSLQFYFLRKEIISLEYIKSIVRYTLAGIVMLISVRFVAYIMTTDISSLLIQVSVGMGVYIIIMWGIKDTMFMNFINVLKKLRIRGR